MFQTKIGSNWPCCFQEEVRNVKLLTHEAQTDKDGRIPIATGLLSDSGDLKKINSCLKKKVFDNRKFIIQRSPLLI